MRARQYFEGLNHVLGITTVSDGSGRAMDLDTAVDAMAELVRMRTGAGRKLMFIGNGGSAAIASHQAVDYWKNGGLKAVAFNDPAQLTCLTTTTGMAQSLLLRFRCSANATIF